VPGAAHACLIEIATTTAQDSYPLFGGVAEQGTPDPNLGAYNDWQTFSSKVQLWSCPGSHTTVTQKFS
jgi:hypothetical protein